jgi:hypothetical protein
VAKSKKEVIVNIVEEAPKLTFVPSYPGEKGIEMDPATVERLEREKQAMLATLHVPQAEPGIVPLPPVIEPLPVEIENVEPVSEVELADARATIERLKVAHDEATKTREEEFQSAMSTAMQNLGELERRQARSVDAQAAVRLREAVESMSSSDVPGAVRATRLDAAQQRVEQLKRRAAPVLAQAAQTRSLLGRFDAEFGEQLNAIREMSYETLTLGASNPVIAHQLHSGIVRSLEDIQMLRGSLENMLGDFVRIDPQEGIIAGFEKGLNECFDVALRRWTQEDSLRYETCLHWLSKASPDAVSTLTSMARGIAGALQRLRSMQDARNTTTPTLRPVALPEPITVEDKLRMGVLPDRAVTAGPFSGGA